MQNTQQGIQKCSVLPKPATPKEMDSSWFRASDLICGGLLSLQILKLLYIKS